jgi:thioester reductase-like protein
MVTTTVADTAAALNTHTESSTTTQQEYRANDDKVQKNSKHARENPAQSTRIDVSSVRQKTIAIIGTTGFLGPYLLASLLQTYTGSNILCINRRADAEQRTLVALKGIAGYYSSRYSRVRFLVADITRQDVGMGPVQDELLASAVDEVIFNAWNPHWGLPLESFQPLLSALVSAIGFCTSSPRQPRITFISSVCAVGEWPRQHPEQRLIPERVVWDSASAMRHGYGQSKCIAEQLLARAHAVSGLSVAIVRAGQIGGPARPSTAYSIWPVQGWLFSIIKASAKIGYWPAHVQPLDWIPVDTLAEGVARVVCGESRAKDVQVLNMMHPQPAPWRLLFATLQSRFGLRAEEVSLPEWLDALEPGALKLDAFLRAAGRGREYDMAVEKGDASALLPEVAPITEDQLVAWIRGWDLKLGHNRAKI